MRHHISFRLSQADACYLYSSAKLRQVSASVIVGKIVSSYSSEGKILDDRERWRRFVRFWSSGYCDKFDGYYVCSRYRLYNIRLPINKTMKPARFNSRQVYFPPESAWRITVYLSDDVYKNLTYQASLQSYTLSSMVTVMVESTIKRARGRPLALFKLR
jgi:hypothetical protein